MSQRTEFLEKIRARGVAELESYVVELRDKLQEKSLRRHFGKKSKDLHEVLKLRRDLARALTILQEKHKEAQS